MPGPEPPAGFEPVDGSPYRPIARSSMFTAIQNGLMSPLTPVRVPLCPRPAHNPVIDRNRHLMLVRSARLNRGRLDDANLARGGPGSVHVRFPNLRAAGNEREVIEGGIYRIVARNLARRANGRILDHVKVAIDLEALRCVAIQPWEQPRSGNRPRWSRRTCR